MIRRQSTHGHMQLASAALVALSLVTTPAWSALGESTELAITETSRSSQSSAQPEVGTRSQAAFGVVTALAKRAQQTLNTFAERGLRPATRPSARGFRRRPLPSNRELRETYTNVIAWPGYNRSPINPIADWENCAACAVALDYTLAGNPSQALPYTRYAAKIDQDIRIESLIKSRDRYRKAAEGLDYVLEQSLLTQEIEADLATKYMKLRKELASVSRRRSRLRTASADLKEQMLISDLFSYYDQADVIARSVGRIGGDWTDFATMREALDVAAQWPDRSKAIVWVDTGEDYAHVFNLLRYNGKTILMDGQIGTGYRRGAFDRATAASLLRTEAVPEWVDIDAMRLPKAIEDVKDVQ